MNKGDKIWFFDGSRCPQEVIFDKYMGKGLSFCKVIFPKSVFPEGGLAVMEQYLFDDFEELIIAVEGHAWVLGKWARENKD